MATYNGHICQKANYKWRSYQVNRPLVVFIYSLTTFLYAASDNSPLNKIKNQLKQLDNTYVYHMT